MRHFFQKLRRVLLDGLFPAYCLGCKTEGLFLCNSCEKSIPRLEKQVCPWCYATSEFGRVCDRCRNKGPSSAGGGALDGLLAGSRFEEHSLLQRSIHQLKYDFVEDLAGPLGRFLFDAFLPLIQRGTLNEFILCPLPLHPKRQRWRGFNQAELLCSSVVHQAKKAGHPNVAMHQVLERTHFSKPQMELKREERIVNVREAFIIRSDVFSAGHWAGKPEDAAVVLVDDIATTLSTLSSAAGPLKKAGIRHIYGLVLARVF